MGSQPPVPLVARAAVQAPSLPRSHGRARTGRGKSRVCDSSDSAGYRRSAPDGSGNRPRAVAGESGFPKSPGGPRGDFGYDAAVVSDVRAGYQRRSIGGSTRRVGSEEAVPKRKRRSRWLDRASHCPSCHRGPGRWSRRLAPAHRATLDRPGNGLGQGDRDLPPPGPSRHRGAVARLCRIVRNERGTRQQCEQPRRSVRGPPWPAEAQRPTGRTEAGGYQVPARRDRDFETTPRRRRYGIAPSTGPGDPRTQRADRLSRRPAELKSASRGSALTKRPRLPAAGSTRPDMRPISTSGTSGADRRSRRRLSP